MLAAASSSIHWLARPHLFTMLFLVLFYGALENVREGRTKLAGIPYLAIFPVATILWANLHGGFFVGVVMIGAYGAAELLTVLFSADSSGRPERLRLARNYFLSAFACLAASLINPYGYQLHEHMATYLRDPWNFTHIIEFLSPSFHHPTAPFFEMMLALGAASACWHLLNRRFTEPLLILLWAHAALLAVRNVAIFAIVAAPPVAAALAYWLKAAPQWDVAAWLRTAAARFNRLESETGETEVDLPLAPGKRGGSPAGGVGHVGSASAAQIPRGVRPGAVSRRPPWPRCAPLLTPAFLQMTSGATISSGASTLRIACSLTDAAISTATISRKSTSTS